MAKAATHHLMESFSLMEGSGSDARIANVILPMTIDTPMNRQFMPDADFGTWSCPTEIAEEILSWVDGSASPPPPLLCLFFAHARARVGRAWLSNTSVL